MKDKSPVAQPAYLPSGSMRRLTGERECCCNFHLLLPAIHKVCQHTTILTCVPPLPYACNSHPPEPAEDPADDLAAAPPAPKRRRQASITSKAAAAAAAGEPDAAPKPRKRAASTATTNSTRSSKSAAAAPKPGPTRDRERRLWQRGFKLVAGVDEAGRGPLAGPVVAAACILPQDIKLPGLDDSKKLTAEERDALYDLITKAPGVVWAV